MRPMQDDRAGFVCGRCCWRAGVMLFPCGFFRTNHRTGKGGSLSILRSGLLAVLVFALTVPSSRAFELDAGMLTTREALYQKWFKGELTLEQFKKAAQDAEKGGKRIHYIKELLDDEELMFKGQRVLKRSGTPAVEGRGVMSDEDLMLRDADELGLSSADRKQYEEMMETYYDRTVKKLRQKAGKVNSDALSTRTADDVLLWKPKPFKSKTMGHIEAEILTKAQEHEYAIYAAAGAGDKAKTIGQAEEAILDNLNKGGKGFAKDPSQWIGDDKMMHKLWDELRITAKDTHRSMKAVDFDTLLPGRYDRYVKLSGMKSMPNKLGIYELGSTLDEQFAGLRIEQEKMRKIMRTALKRSRTETATQIDDLLKRMKTIDSVSEMDVLMRQAGEVSDRMYRIGENFKHLEN
ncbi:MAG: hypothetical protein HN341_00130, partial [Verrucomicrobia bacterium]|nr:hypothetical protein [Verrucomicrobiota bacterium]